MPMPNLRTVDLNLLVAFDALMTERNVTRAAGSIGLSQPAMSNALARLRVVFSDPLLVRTPNGMQPTMRAVELIDMVQGALNQVRRVFDKQPAFDPASANQNFVVRMGDMNELIFLPRIIAALRARAPGITLEVKHLSPEGTIAALEADSVELALSTGLRHTSSVQSKGLLPDQIVLVLRKGHPFITAKNQVGEFLELAHIRVSQSPADTRFLDDYLARRKLKRHVVLTLPHWLAAPAVAAQTDLVTVVSARMALELDDRLAILPLPLGPQRFTWTLYWHRRHETQAAHHWLRSLIEDVARTLADPA
jgi:DNA-binding transcriptional LysR family regulator